MAGILSGYSPRAALAWVGLFGLIGLNALKRLTATVTSIRWSHRGSEMMMMKCQFHWWRKLEYPEETTDLRQVNAETFLTYEDLSVGHFTCLRTFSSSIRSCLIVRQTTACSC